MNINHPEVNENCEKRGKINYYIILNRECKKKE